MHKLPKGTHSKERGLNKTDAIYIEVSPQIESTERYPLKVEVSAKETQLDRNIQPTRIEKLLKAYSWLTKNDVKTFEKAYKGKSRATAIKAKCIDCVCGQKGLITNCESILCTLWNYRPYQARRKYNG